jgi:hypothetical protein
LTDADYPVMQDLPIQEAVLKRKFDNSFSEELHVTALRRKFKGYNTLTQFLVVCYKKKGGCMSSLLGRHYTS